MTRRFSSISTQTTLATSISNSALSLVVATGTASTLLGGVALTAGNVDQFKIILDPDTASSEICYVTEVTSDTLTIARGKDGTSAVSHTGGAVIKHVLTGEDLTYFTTGVVPTSNLAVGLPFPGSTSGTATLKAPAVAGTTTVTLPGATDTLVGKATTDTLTNKTLTSPILTTPNLGVPSAIDLTNATNVPHDSTKISNTLLTTTGDTVYASSANTPARLAIGSTGNVLTVAGGVPSWAAPAASAVTQIAQVVLAGAQATISFPSIPSTYSNLRVVWETAVAAGAGNLLLRCNADTGANYDAQGALGYGTTANILEQFAATSMKIGQVDSVVAGGQITIPNYKLTTLNKMAIANFFKSGGTTTGLLEVGTFGGRWRNTAAITQLDFTNDAGNFPIGTVFTLYGEM